MDLPDPAQLIAAQKSLDAICKFIQADSLGYLTVDGMLSVLKAYPKSDYCTACFSGEYAFPVQDRDKFSLEASLK
eukprot:COSAG02_NODE_16003_length_1122_cov_0.956012_2_plen_75_part_00